MEFKEETGMPNTVIGILEVEGNKNGSATGVKLEGEKVN